MNQIIHSTNSFFDRGVRVWAMTEEEVEIFQLQSFEGLAAGLEDVFARQALVVWSVASPEDFARDNYALARPSQFLEHVPHDNLGLPVSVGLGTIEEIDTHLVCRLLVDNNDLFADLSPLGYPEPKDKLGKFKSCSPEFCLVLPPPLPPK